MVEEKVCDWYLLRERSDRGQDESLSSGRLRYICIYFDMNMRVDRLHTMICMQVKSKDKRGRSMQLYAETVFFPVSPTLHLPLFSPPSPLQIGGGNFGR
jgi:hypothetical protein